MDRLHRSHALHPQVRPFSEAVKESPVFHERLLEFRDASINLAAGPMTGPPLVFLHGVCRNWKDWVVLLPTFLPRWQVFAYDHRGHGGSDRTKTYNLQEYVDDAIRVLRSQFREPAVLFGHSLGGLVSIGVAVQAPDLVRGIILEDPPSPLYLKDLKKTTYHTTFECMRDLAGPHKTVQEIARGLANVRIALTDGKFARLADLRDATSLRFSARCLQQLDPKVLDPVLDGSWVQGLDLWELAPKVACPVLLLRGNEAQGGMLPKKDGESFSRLFPDCTAIDMVNVGHLIHWMAPQTTERLALGFLESLR